MELAGKVAVVTGAGSGIGRAIAHELVQHGCRVAAVGRRAEKLEETVQACDSEKGISAFPTDVSVREQVARLVENVVSECGAPDIVVNNAGVNVQQRDLARLSLDDWDYLVRVNLTGVFQIIHGFLPVLRERGSGLIINVSSIAGVRPSPLGGAGYSAAKFGVNALSGVVSLEESKHGIRSSVICPGEVATPILDERPVPVSAERKAAMLQPEDVAAAVLFIARLPARAHVPELIIKPAVQDFA